MTAADHANTVREAIGADTDAPDSEQREAAALAALDALQTERDRLAEALREAISAARWMSDARENADVRDDLEEKMRELEKLIS